MALLDSYASLAQLKARVNETTTNNDVALASALAAASRDLEGCLGRQFNDAGIETARVYYPDDLTTIYCDDFQSSAGFILAFDFSNSGVYANVITSTNYQFEPLNGVVDGTPGWPYYRLHVIQTWPPMLYTSIGYPRASVQITARWGWAAVPDPIVEATLMLAEETWKMKDAPFGVAGFSAMGSALRVRQNPKIYELVQRYDREPIKVR